MVSTNLVFNILTFDLPVKQETFYFSESATPEGHRIHRNLFPEAISELFPVVDTDGFDYLYTTFTIPTEGYQEFTFDTSTVKLALLKRHFNYLIHSYFKENGFIVQDNFVDDVEVRIPAGETNTFHLFDKFTLRVQFKKVSQHGELMIAYNGQSKILKQSVTELLSGVPPLAISKILYKNKLYSYHKLTPEENELIDLSEAFALLNLKIAHALHWSIEAPVKSNKYIKFTDKVIVFCKEHLNNTVFLSLIPLQSLDFLQVNVKYIGHVKDESNSLVFADNHTNIVPFAGLKKGPNTKCMHSVVHIFFICHENDKQLANNLAVSLKNGLGAFPGLYNLVKISYHIKKEETVVFKNADDPFPEIEAELFIRELNPDIQYFAIYLSPFDKFNEDKEKRKIYYRLKYLLLNKKIHSQVLVKEKIGTGDKFKDYGYSLNNIAIAALAKLGGIPWRIQTTKKKELVVGVGAFKNTEIGVRYIGSAFSFQNNGQFNEFDCFLENDTSVLAGSIQEAVIRFSTVNAEPERLIIHFFKIMSQKEIDPILKKLQNLELNIPVFVVSINKTETKDIIAWDPNWKHLMPKSGTYIKIGWNNYLLFNNTRYAENTQYCNEGYPFPVKLQISCTNEDLLDGNTVRDLIDQVYQFSRMYWKSVRQQHLPVTIKYPEMVAEIYPHFESYALPDFAKDKLWFL
jgi:hypothetical protein